MDRMLLGDIVAWLPNPGSISQAHTPRTSRWGRCHSPPGTAISPGADAVPGLAFVATLVVAALSWRLVEAPALARKPR